MSPRLLYVSIFKTRGFCVLEIKTGKCSKPLCSAFMFPIVVAQRWALDVREDQHEKLWEKKIKIWAESSLAHINLSVSVMQRVWVYCSKLWVVACPSNHAFNLASDQNLCLSVWKEGQRSCHWGSEPRIPSFGADPVENKTKHAL